MVSAEALIRALELVSLQESIAAPLINAFIEQFVTVPDEAGELARRMLNILRPRVGTKSAVATEAVFSHLGQVNPNIQVDNERDPRDGYFIVQINRDAAEGEGNHRRYRFEKGKLIEIVEAAELTDFGIMQNGSVLKLESDDNDGIVTAVNKYRVVDGITVDADRWLLRKTKQGGNAYVRQSRSFREDDGGHQIEIKELARTWIISEAGIQHDPILGYAFQNGDQNDFRAQYNRVADKPFVLEESDLARPLSHAESLD